MPLLFLENQQRISFKKKSRESAGSSALNSNNDSRTNRADNSAELSASSFLHDGVFDVLADASAAGSTAPGAVKIAGTQTRACSQTTISTDCFGTSTPGTNCSRSKPQDQLVPINLNLHGMLHCVQNLSSHPQAGRTGHGLGSEYQSLRVLRGISEEYAKE
uniref:(northern house mosquito) hypothetical protein n=1 Tax=Culex pipiens TaxID=7175 RepID=A0A8D8NMH5_CULPI